MPLGGGDALSLISQARGDLTSGPPPQSSRNPESSESSQQAEKMLRNFVHPPHLPPTWSNASPDSAQATGHPCAGSLHHRPRHILLVGGGARIRARRACSACLMSKTFFFSLPPSHLAAAPPLRARRRETRPWLCPLYPRPGWRLQKKSWHDASRLRAGTRPSTLCRSPPPDTKAEPSTPKHKHAAWPAVFAPGAMAWRR